MIDYVLSKLGINKVQNPIEFKEIEETGDYCSLVNSFAETISTQS